MYAQKKHCNYLVRPKIRLRWPNCSPMGNTPPSPPHVMHGDVDITSRFKTGLTKWKDPFVGSFEMKRCPLSKKIKDKCWRITVWLALIYGSQCWAVKKGQEQRMQEAEKRILRYMNGMSRRNGIRNYIRMKHRVGRSLGRDEKTLATVNWSYDATAAWGKPGQEDCRIDSGG